MSDETYTEYRLTGDPGDGYPPYEFTTHDKINIAALRVLWSKYKDKWISPTFTKRTVRIQRTEWEDVE